MSSGESRSDDLLTIRRAPSSLAVRRRLWIQWLLRRVLARGPLMVLGNLPALGLLALLWRDRHRPLVEILATPATSALVGLSLVGLALVRYRTEVLDVIDRRFFRERYAARRVLGQLADQVRTTRNLADLASTVRRGVDFALGLERVALLALDPVRGRFVDPLERMRPLDPGSKLATLVQSRRAPLEIDLEVTGAPLAELPEPELHWLIDGKVELLAPAFALEGSMNGLLVLGHKTNGEPFLSEDRQLLQKLSAAIGLVMELHNVNEHTPSPRDQKILEPSDSGSRAVEVETGQKAQECASCSRVYPGDHERCPRCDLILDGTLVPYVLRGQLRFEERIGTGGMAVVYRATDLRLGRTVAIKTLPRVSPEAAVRLHREARAAASVTHPGLASIYGIETWEGVPMLILELLTGGTLAERLMRDPLEVPAMLEVGKSVALALERIHSAGILHRDVKPSNIGFTGDGDIKLLDFGIARIQYDITQDGDTPFNEQNRTTLPVTSTRWIADRTVGGRLIGTASYLSPEALNGDKPGPAHDLWALSVVLYESLTAENLFLMRSVPQMLDAIRNAQVPDLRTKIADCPWPLASFFRRELSPRSAERAPNGFEYHERLEVLERELVRADSSLETRPAASLGRPQA
ncbi:MAG: protein kinase [Acidobacteriota bacterium]